MINEKVTVEKAKELASKIRVEEDGVVFSADLRMPDYNVSIEEAVVYAYVCHYYETGKHFSISSIKSNVGYSFNVIDKCLKSLENKGYVYRNAYYLPIFDNKSKPSNKHLIDVIKYLISNSKRYNEEGLWINVIDCLISDISDVEFCFGCKHYKGEGDSFCDMCGEKVGQDAICRNSLIERAKKGKLNIKENKKCTD